MKLHLLERLSGCRRVLLAGAGGGFDFCVGLPLQHALLEAGIEVEWANLTFAPLQESDGEWLTPVCCQVSADSTTPSPERSFCRWFANQGQSVSVYCLLRTGVQPLRAAYRELISRLDIDAVVLVDGGSDSLMRGDEAGLGSPSEDLSSVAAVHGLKLETKLLCCLGFGIDSHHGVCHAHFLEAVAGLTAVGGFLGAFSLLPGEPESRHYEEVMAFLDEDYTRRQSVIHSSIRDAISGHFGDYHSNSRTQGSELFINPLMALYWNFELSALAERCLYLEELEHTQSIGEVTHAIAKFRSKIEKKQWTSLPM